MKILITGGHVTPALAVIEKLNGHEIVFVGRKYALDSERTLSFEYKETTAKNIRFVELQAGRITRLLSARSFLNVLKLPIGFFNAFRIIRGERPDIVLSFGSYLAAPIVFWAFVFGIPVYTHEQTMISGMANRFIAKFSKKIFLAFADSARYFPQNKTRVVGNPVRSAIFKVQKKPFNIRKDRSVIFVTGGSLGSHSINEHIKKILPKLTERYIVIHQTGDTKEYNDYEELAKLKSARYFPQKHFSEEEIGYVYSVADIIIGRAGANTFFELVALQKPAIFVPLPWSAHKEQQAQAQIFKEAGAGEIFVQSDKSEQLLSLVNEMIVNIEEYKKNVMRLSDQYERNAADVIVAEIVEK